VLFAHGKEGRKMSSYRASAALLSGVAAVAVLSGANAWAQEQDAQSQSKIETIVVTAEKRTESAHDVPMAMTVLSGDKLTHEGLTRLEDYIDMVPGMTLISANPGYNQIVSRGISIGAAGFTSGVATYIDETPYTTEGPFANGGSAAPNLDTYDLQRVEFLQGPQGTLYGTNALGGLVKYVTNAPDTSGFAASAQAGFSSVDHGGTGYDLHGMVNVPLADDAALRVVGYDNLYPGFIDDPSRNAKDINDVKIAGLRASLLYAPTDDFSIRLNVFYQTLQLGDYSTEDVYANLQPVYGDLTQERAFNQSGHVNNEIYSATIKWNVGFADLLSTTSYMGIQPTYPQDFSAFYPGSFGPDGAALLFSEPVHGITQEARLSSHEGGPIDWQVGGFFTSQNAQEFEAVVPFDYATGQIISSDLTDGSVYYINSAYKEYAGYANVDYHIIPTLDVALGGRYSSNVQSYHQVNSGAFVGPGDFSTRSSEGVFTYSGDVRWHVTSDTMAYGRIATGYVPGGPNDVLPGSNLPESYHSSTTTNYEVGVKNNLLDGRLSIDVDVFDVEWKDIQLIAQVGALYGATNGGTARSDGLEWAFGYIPVDGLTLNFSGAYTDARLTAATPASVGGVSGDALPYSALWTTTTSVNYERPLFDDYSGFVNARWHYSGSRESEFSPYGREILPGYSIVDLRLGVENDRWSLAVYAKNLADERAFTAITSYVYESATVMTPRTIGVELSAKL
jgi:outer membrane receptor protein involved in Fe transport